MVAKIKASARTGRHCWRVNEANFGRAAASRRAPATHWRTATTPAGPRAGKASAAVAAPTWLDAALPVISAMPVSRPGGPAPAAPGEARRCGSHIGRVMAGAWATPAHAQNTMGMRFSGEQSQVCCETQLDFRGSRAHPGRAREHGDTAMDHRRSRLGPDRGGSAWTSRA